MTEMAATKPVLWMTVEDPYAVYGPGDKVRGTAHVEVVNPLLTKYIIVSLLAGNRISPGVGEKPTKQSFFHKQFKIPFHNRREDAQRCLSAGAHEWEFEFTFPQTNDLPPSFIYKDSDGTAEILYCLVMCVYRSASTGPNKENMSTLPIKYSPKRSASMAVDGSKSNKYLCQPLLVKPSLPRLERSRIPQFINHILHKQRIDRERFHVTLWLPRYATFTDHIDMSLKIEAVPKKNINTTPQHGPMNSIQARLVRIEYRLWALTTIMHDEASRTSRHQVQNNVCHSSTLLETNEHWASLRRHAPFRVQPRLHGMPFDKVSFGSLSPSFGWQNIIREYSLDVDIFIKLFGAVHRVRFENNELVILPHDVYLENE